ncbi:glycosyltransferase involved in cell wall biosynthesis [Acetoanaerobium pronyense]|uniref:Glycosyltransferase involved in cell wall biosynthesis n=1 Tax=Acetoanaerobium pronyense TaxID=1482736 RepID=A0ABS4KL64_9FIRM|nr:glycosyltransferase family 4 protein [Acetoanaerobium pronyense]MBP2028533.1 glycosyltransferase involved in cell wall biosynthesis [Acetoanaerobium pronyense]
MNDFISLRKDFFRNRAINQNQAFDKFYLESIYTNTCENEKVIFSDFITSFKTLNKINQLYFAHVLLLEKLKAKETHNHIKYGILDIFIESHLDVLDDSSISLLIEENLESFDLLSIVLEYIYFFNKKLPHKFLLNLFSLDIPSSIKIQLLDIFHQETIFNKDVLIKIIEKEKDKNLLVEYLGFLENDIKHGKNGITIVQTMFYGDPEESGMGKSGGLGTLLKSLGNTLSSHEDISNIITISINRTNRKIITQSLNKHLMLRIPIYINQDDPNEFLLKENHIKRRIKRFLYLLNITPDIFHIRYLDNASMAVANLSKDISSKLVFTVTPDPHRNMTDENEALKTFHLDELLFNLNKINIGDELIDMADGIIGIGREKVKEELFDYFPVLKAKKSIFKMIGEGINLNITYTDFELSKILASQTLNHPIDKDMLSRPFMLNVGRLSFQKGQDKLLKAWGESRLSDDYNLLIIGGSLENPTLEEKPMIDFFQDFITENPNLKGKFAHLNALSNEEIRSIEKTIVDHAEKSQTKYPPIYICSSIKEEFGISILEAMYETFLTFAPKKGGAKTYIKEGVNGFLIDTSSSEKIAFEVEQVIYGKSSSKKDFRDIRVEGKSTVEENFSIERISKDFASFYKKILYKGEN